MGRLIAAVCCSVCLGWAADAIAADELDGSGAALAVQQMILSKPGGAEKVLSLQDHPDVQSLLQDEAVLKAVRSGDFGAIAQDARVESLLQHPTVRALASDLQR